MLPQIYIIFIYLILYTIYIFLYVFLVNNKNTYRNIYIFFYEHYCKKTTVMITKIFFKIYKIILLCVIYKIICGYRIIFIK